MKRFANDWPPSAQNYRNHAACLLLAVLSGFAALAEAAANQPPQIPAYASLPIYGKDPVTIAANGELRWLGLRMIEPRPSGLPKGCVGWEIVMDRWNPATGATQREPLEPTIGSRITAQLPLPYGLLALTTGDCKEDGKPVQLVLLPSDGTPPLKLTINEDSNFSPDLLVALDDDAAALVTRDKETRHILVYTVRRQNNELVLETMPPLAIAYRRDYAAAAAGKDQLMILGGSDGDYRGCSPCRAETHVLNLKTKQWHNGPSLLEARSELGASSLPDGSILVTGGWTNAANWGNGPSRTAERWNPETNQFEALPPMPTGNARHKHLWWTAPWGKILLVTQGLSGAAHSFDPATRTWRTVGEWIQGSEEGGCGFFPFVFNGNAYAWLKSRSEGHYSSKSCIDQKYATLSLLRPPTLMPAASSPPPENMLITYLHHAAFLPASGSEPALIIGGARHAGMNNFTTSSAVEAIDREGRIVSLPSLRHARHGAHAFRVAGGILVLGGTGPDLPYGDTQNLNPLPTEWLPPAEASSRQWLEVSGAAIVQGSAIGQLKDESLLVVKPGGEILQLQLTVQNGQLGIARTPWPGLTRERQNGSNEQNKIQVQELADGRIVVAGGEVRAERIALYSEDALTPDKPDHYVDIGPFVPSRQYEIFDPVTRRWNHSAPSSAAGGWARIMNDGQVIKAGDASSKKTNSEPGEIALEISHPTGSTWSSVARTGSRLLANQRYQTFSLEGELFAKGELYEANTHWGPEGLEWFNPRTQQWELLWQADKDDNWRKHQGQILVRQLINADGKKKTVIIPVGGL